MKPTINLFRGNIPSKITIGRRSQCWRCENYMAKNDKAFQVPGPTRKSSNGAYYRSPNRRYCEKCMRDNVLRAEKELGKIKKMVG
jgi:hypothetical protein